MEIEKMISELDTAVGMLIVAAMKDPTVKEAMEKVSNVSFELGRLAD
jgi:hypothetical protein